MWEEDKEKLEQVMKLLQKSSYQNGELFV